MSWTAQWSKTAIKQLKKLPKKDQKRILLKTVDVEENPFVYLSKLSGEPFFRFRVGDYRIFCDVINKELLIMIVKVKGRGGAYKR